MLNDLLHILLGGALVALGVLAAGLADRIRGLRADRSAAAPASRALTGRTRQPIEVVEAEVVPPRAAKRAGSQPQPVKDSAAGEVIAALVAAGYKRTIAAEAVWACVDQERSTIEMWVKAALRRAVSGSVAS